MLFMLVAVPVESPRAQKIGPQCQHCTFSCYNFYQQCIMDNSPCDNDCVDECYEVQAACQQQNCVDTGICPFN
jgi:hypothetical protein